MSGRRAKTIPTFFARAAAFILLAGVVYSATFGAVHTHLNTSSVPGVTVSASAANQAGISTTPLRRGSDANECLTCILHRQFSSSTVHTPVFVIGPSTEVAFTSSPAVFYSCDPTYSRPLTRISGRAPPLV